VGINRSDSENPALGNAGNGLWKTRQMANFSCLVNRDHHVILALLKMDIVPTTKKEGLQLAEMSNTPFG
jgi:hypothetical protein